MTDRAEYRDSRKYRLAEREDDTSEYSEISGAVNGRALLKLRGDRLDIGLDENDVVGGNDTRDYVCQEVIGKTEH